jgi:gamma-polyglutamate synthase
MAGSKILLLIFVVLILLGFWEAFLQRRNLSRMPIRVHVNGTRGKSSVVRLIAGGLRESGIRTCAKTTGTLARMILPDASEYPVFRPGGANVIEQVRIVSAAASYDAQAIVVECMALQPQLQWMCESRFIKATHGVITNARADHLDVMGPEEKDVALALAATTPVKAKLFTAEGRFLHVFEDAAKDRQTRLFHVSPDDISSITDEEMEGFQYVEHRENVALALRVCLDLGIDRETALRGMWKAPPDPGVMTISHIRFFGRHIHFVNVFAANDPESTERLWNMALEKFPDVEKRIIIFNCRSDRPHRSEQLGAACSQWRPADSYVLMGSGTHFLERAAILKGVPAKKFISAEHQSDGDIFELIIEQAGKSAVVVGMGNAKGQGLSLVRFFRNRSILKEVA